MRSTDLLVLTKSYLHLWDGSLWRVVEVAQGIQLPAQLAEEMLELVLEFLLRVILRYAHGLLQELHSRGQPNGRQEGTGSACDTRTHTREAIFSDGFVKQDEKIQRSGQPLYTQQ